VGFAKTITANLSLAASVVRNTTYTRVTTSNLTLSLTIVITAVGRFLKILVAAGNVYVVKGIESSVYKMKTVAGNVNIISVASGVVHNVKTFAGRVYHMIIKEVR